MKFRPVINYNSNQHITQLDAIRGWAILLVLLYHFYADHISFLGIGWAGVDLFFVLSGFLITGILLDTKGKPAFFKNFYVKRVLRIFPVYFFVLAIMLYVIPAISITAIPDLPYYLKHQPWFWTYFQNWLFTFQGYPTDRVLRYTWSLCIEEQFYMFWPFLIYRLNTKNIIRVLLIFIITANLLRLIQIDGWNDNYKYVNTFARLDTISIGALIAVLIRTRKDILEKYTPFVMVLSVTMLVVIIGYKKSLYFGNLYAAFTFLALLFGSIIIWSLSSNIPRGLSIAVNNRTMIFLGKYSYGIYLYHVPIHFWVTTGLLDYLSNTGSLNIYTTLLIKTAILLITIGISVLSFKYFETPFLKLKKKFTVRK
ncbi:acyltransferase [Chitinophaga sp. MM2321]|uniref:acyltransferase family protein n=1 Tax=Chitinophaga sp. MM2321 TaxID=3137178 RepID=UPI0032D575CF